MREIYYSLCADIDVIFIKENNNSKRFRSFIVVNELVVKYKLLSCHKVTSKVNLDSVHIGRDQMARQSFIQIEKEDGRTYRCSLIATCRRWEVDFRVLEKK